MAMVVRVAGAAGVAGAVAADDDPDRCTVVVRCHCWILACCLAGVVCLGPSSCQDQAACCPVACHLRPCCWTLLRLRVVLGARQSFCHQLVEGVVAALASVGAVAARLRQAQNWVGAAFVGTTTWTTLPTAAPC